MIFQSRGYFWSLSNVPKFPCLIVHSPVYFLLSCYSKTSGKTAANKLQKLLDFAKLNCLAVTSTTAKRSVKLTAQLYTAMIWRLK